MSSRIPVPENVPGDFYVENNCCLRCEVPMAEAPEHFEFSEQSCYVCKQPQTPEEIERMTKAMQVQELECIRYKGNQREVQIKLVAMGAGACCDDLPVDLGSPPPKASAPARKHWASALWRRVRR